MLTKRINRFFQRYIESSLDERSTVHHIRRRKGGLKQWSSVISDMLAGDYSAVHQLRSDWFVALDDIGAEYGRNRDLATAKLFEILNGREGLFTVINANLSMENIAESMDTRIASRLIRDGSIVVDIDFDTPDFALRH